MRGATLVGIALVVSLIASRGASGAGLSGDFDGDGFDDLAVGVQSEDVGGETLAGGVHVIYGSRRGLSARDRMFTRATPGVRGAPGDDGFGSALAVGRFDAGRFDDLAIGVPFDDVTVGGEQIQNVGSVQILYGGPRGLTARGDDLLSHGRNGFGDPPAEFDGFGWSLATGNLNRDRRHELVASTPFGAVAGAEDAGFIEILRGSREGLTPRGARRISQTSSGIADAPDADDRFGWSLALGNVGRSARRDLAIGVPGEDVGTADGAGAVHVLFGGRRRLRTKGSQYLDQGVLLSGSESVDAAPEDGDRFGSSLTMGRIDDRAREDLAIGTPGEDVEEEFGSPVPGGGAVSIGWGGADGVRTAPGESGALLNDSPNGGFGYALVASDFGGERFEDLAIGAPFAEAEGAQPDSGTVLIAYGGPAGGYQDIAQGEDDFADLGENSDFFGVALAAGRFDGKGRTDLAIGVPGEDVLVDGLSRSGPRRGAPVPTQDVGAVQIVPGTAGGLSAADDFLLHRDSPGIAGSIAPGDFFGVALGGRDGAPTFD